MVLSLLLARVFSSTRTLAQDLEDHTALGQLDALMAGPEPLLLEDQRQVLCDVMTIYERLKWQVDSISA
ncbi:hypothetical protein [Deinococcus navajonensis]|uniref:Transposase-like protein DUF772 n=1 Tax=Deinococcus navajonensis TaxID=309884 RepID=A0ABV8XJG3_9DEIO